MEIKMDKMKMTDCLGNIWTVLPPRKILPELKKIEADPKECVNWFNFSDDSIFWDADGNPYRVDIDREKREVFLFS